MSENTKSPIDQTLVLAGFAAAVLLVLVLIVFWPTGSDKSVINETSTSNVMNEFIEKQEQYLTDNGQQQGVVVTESGLQYEVLTRSGSEMRPAASDTVTVHYEGRLIDGSIFDSSYQRNQTIDFPLNGVIPGWTEGVQYMAIGDKFKFTIPSDLAYGKSGAGGVIPPHATLVFDVELLKINGKTN